MKATMKRLRRLLWGVLIAGCAFGLSPYAEAADPAGSRPDPVGVHILVIAAQRSGQGIDRRLAKAGLAKELQRLGYLRARVLDELNARVERGARVSLQMPSRRQNLKVRLLEAKPSRRQYRLELAIPEERFQMTTNHRDGGTVLIFLPPRPSRPDIGLAVTPRR